jgi:hypothetical protein
MTDKPPTKTRPKLMNKEASMVIILLGTALGVGFDFIP